MLRTRRIVTLLMLGVAAGAFAQEEESPRYVGGLTGAETEANAPKPVRNDVAQPSDPVVAVRTFRIKKGTFDDFLKASREGVWPYFEKIGARVVGMWKVIHPTVDGDTIGEDSPDYDEVVLMTQYASIEHWRATRDTIVHGGNGPDWDACLAALTYRRSVTIETSVQFLKGETWTNPPYFMPGLNERYERVK